MDPLTCGEQNLLKPISTAFNALHDIKAFLENLLVINLIKKSPALIERESSLPCSHKSSEPVQSTLPQPTSPLHISIYRDPKKSFPSINCNRMGHIRYWSILTMLGSLQYAKA
jgi:hypothetical protein